MFELFFRLWLYILYTLQLAAQGIQADIYCFTAIAHSLECGHSHSSTYKDLRSIKINVGYSVHV